MRERRLTEQLVVRVEPELAEALAADAAENGRTVAQSIRFYLHQTFAWALDEDEG
jgi:predicted HicB family RNase H-like nuclease